MTTSSEERHSPGAANQEVAEFQGLYGAYSVSETLLQKVWLRGEFDLSRARTLAGETVRILNPGTWNRLSGPDFRGARLVLGDRAITGDIEVHFLADAWTQHGHHTDPAYDDVVLHVVLFPPREHQPLARTSQGREIPVLVLVDLLWHDLEEYASDDAVAALSGRDPFPLLEELLGKPPAERNALIREAAHRRWREKVHFAGRRIERLGWHEACHQTTLEILGYRSNRVAMLRVGEIYPWTAWREGPPGLEAVVAVAADWWTLRGVRPANQPRRRLAQYRTWVQRAGDWPGRLRTLALPALPAGASDLEPGLLRRRAEFPRWRAAIARELCGGEFDGTRLDTWIINLVFPFLASGRSDTAAEVGWHAWFPGDAPESFLAASQQLAPATVRHNGFVQGLLGLELARVVRPVVRDGGGEPSGN